MSQLSPVAFHGDTIFCIDYQGQPYTPMKPIVENMGLDWSAQAAKFRANKERWAVVMITTVAQDGKEREVLCVPIRKLPAFLASINPKKVREGLRPKIELYQNECDNALWAYWMEGRAERVTTTPPADDSLTPDQQCTLQAIVRAKVEALPAPQQSKGTYPKVWSRFNNHFRIARYSQLPQARMSEAVTYLTRMEVLPAQEQLALPATSAVLDERVQKVQSLVNEVKQRGNEFTSSVLALESALRFRPATMDTLVPAFGRTLERNLPSMSMAINMNVRALCDLLDVYNSTLTGTTDNASSPAPVQPGLPATGNPYEDANAKLEEMRRKYHALRDEAGSLLVEVMMDDERRMPPQLLVKMPTPITDMTESFFRNSIDLHQSWSSNPVLLIRELHNALGLKRTVPLD